MNSNNDNNCNNNCKLTVIEGPDAGTEFELSVLVANEEIAPRGVLTIGRDPSVAIALSDPAVSREHFRLEMSPRGFRLVDAGSRNRTFLNGAVVREEFLEDGDTIRIGDTELRYAEGSEALEKSGAVSTIIKQLPASNGSASFIERIEDLERTLEEARTREALESIQQLLGLYGRIAATSSVRELFEKLLEQLASALVADSGVVLAREGTERWIVRARHPADAPRASGFSSAVVAKAAEEQSAILAAETRTDERFRDRASIVGEEIVSALAAPVISPGRERTEAVLYFDRRGEKRPFTESDLQLLAAAAEPVGALLERLAEQDELRRENKTLYRSLTAGRRIVGRSQLMQKVFEFVQRAAPTPMTVLITGETGTGKELVASAIHYASPRRGNPFVALNCAALAENLVESELFGHERGAFTGAVARRKGRFELADTGTVFLDEIGELSLACQAKLLRLLEERSFERVGGAEPIRVDVRVIAATNRDLLGEVETGRFREDLYYRLNVLQVALPSLKERPDDIPLLAEHFVASASGGVKRLSKRAEEKLRSYDWPGNVRQLRNVIESAVVLGEGPEIGPDDLVLPSRARPAGAMAAETASAETSTWTWTPCSLAEIEKEHVQRVLEHTGGNKKRAAEILGIERCTLYSKLKSHGLFSPNA